MECRIVVAQLQNDSVFNREILRSIPLNNPHKNKITSLDFSTYTQSLVLFIFLSPECPLSQNYSVALNELYLHYKAEVKVYGIFPGKAYKNNEITKFISKYTIRFPVFVDTEKKLTNYLHASVTPEVILLTTQSLLIYRGAIDNRVQDLGVKRVKVTNYYLKDAIEQTVQKKHVLLKRTSAVGCLINEF